MDWIDRNCPTPTHPYPEDRLKDDWVLSRKSIYGGGIIIDRHLEPPDEIVIGATEHHYLGYLLNDFAPQQITQIANTEFNHSNNKGNFWLKPNYTAGSWHWAGTNEALIIAIEPNFLHRVAVETNCVNPHKIEVQPVLNSRDATMDYIVRQFRHEIINAKLGNQMYVESLANMFALNLLRNYCTFSSNADEYQGGLSSRKLKRAIDYVNDNLEENIRLTDIAESLGISQYYFCRLFRESTGISPYRYVLQQRIDKVKRLIELGQMSLADIAFECGFSSQSQMTQHFRKFVGVTPKVYQNEL